MLKSCESWWRFGYLVCEEQMGTFYVHVGENVALYSHVWTYGKIVYRYVIYIAAGKHRECANIYTRIIPTVFTKSVECAFPKLNTRDRQWRTVSISEVGESLLFTVQDLNIILQHWTEWWRSANKAKLLKQTKLACGVLWFDLKASKRGDVSQCCLFLFIYLAVELVE